MLGAGGIDIRARRTKRSAVVICLGVLTMLPGVTAFAQTPPDSSTTTTTTTPETTTTESTTTTTTTAPPITEPPPTTAPAPPPSPPPPPPPPPPPAQLCTINQALAFGSRGDEVRCLQQAINADRAVDIGVDGVYGNSTVAAVRDFQRAVGLAVTGRVDAATAQRYNIWGGGAAAAPAPAPTGGCVSRQLAFGARGDDVRCLQNAINADRITDIAVSGYYGAQTRSAVRDFQAAVGLPASGVLDPATAERYGIWGGAAAAAPAPAPAPVAGACVARQLAFGTSGDDVRCLQHAINADRTTDISVTGYYGSQTRAAVRDFQAAVGLSATGVLDPATAERYGIWGGGAVAAPAPAPVADASGIPANSGSGRRVVYHRGQQRIWAVESDGTVVKTHFVSGRRFEPYAGTYRVYSRSMYTYSTADPNVKWRYMVRFAYGPGGGRIGFHEIPSKFGAPLQSERQLGQPLSGGCVRQSTADAIWMWNWAGVGTTVVVL